MERKVEAVSFDGITVEYSLIGEGEPVLVMHGGHSNCNEEFGYQALVENGFTVITPSRPGYGRTSKEAGKDLAKACEYYVKLLDHLKLKNVHVLAISAGGPSGIWLAANYPERISTLTLQSAVTKEWLKPSDKEYKVPRALFHPKTERSGFGFLLDLAQVNAITSDDLRAITCPTLMMHSKHDRSVPLDHAHYAQEQIPGSKLCILESWGHLIWLGASSAVTDETVIAFLQSKQRS
ncbi:alpha/beta hydrolase [Alkalihalobacillus oceani]|uniref:Alpha/beta hydrolase n=1 Tax=Halalkalibacter oceani TaxID=1653776 RepID=A0A9X2DW49_9BACI|nr:alpha/beta hydrolase [Halalkalibacter oceani]MCM3716530.1 alpha/beta hydrolase [Halalkalibacter oceani]